MHTIPPYYNVKLQITLLAFKRMAGAPRIHERGNWHHRRRKRLWETPCLVSDCQLNFLQIGDELQAEGDSAVDQIIILFNKLDVNLINQTS
jgi:hypothetical protein